MNFINSYKSEISALCEKHRVKEMYVFGSVLTDSFNSDSDVDLIVEFDNVDLNSYANNYFDLKISLQNLLKHRVDLLEQQALKNPYFIRQIQTKRQLIYG
jgi:hypothetical protein